MKDYQPLKLRRNLERKSARLVVRQLRKRLGKFYWNYRGDRVNYVTWFIMCNQSIKMKILPSRIFLFRWLLLRVEAQISIKLIKLRKKMSERKLRTMIINLLYFAPKQSKFYIFGYEGSFFIIFLIFLNAGTEHDNINSPSIPLDDDVNFHYRKLFVCSCVCLAFPRYAEEKNNVKFRHNRWRMIHTFIFGATDKYRCSKRTESFFLPEFLFSFASSKHWNL